ncbi:MAG: alpha/beta hydrolase, partial [Clostridiales Family XIII bacterium]|nr:alpha/beta hydrolase [Clostridiales Family XIII bacterium]
LFLTRRWVDVNGYYRFANVWTENDSYERDGANIPVRVYRPTAPGKGGDEALPVIVYIHGGAFSLYNPDIYDPFLRGLSQTANAVVVAPDYRLTPEYKFPTGFDDSYAGLLWAKENAARFGGSPDTIFIGGDSSGGNFAAAAALKARDENGPKISGQILIYPFVIFNPDKRDQSEERYGKGYFLEYNSQDKGMTYYFNDYADSDTPYASPLLAESLQGLPRAIYLGAECDPLLDQGLMYAAKLEDDGNDVEVKIYEGMIHGYINQPYKETFDTLKRIREFVGKASS